MSILVVNAGSSSVKFGLFDFESLQPIVRGLLDWAGRSGRAQLTLTPQTDDATPASEEPSSGVVTMEIDAPDYRAGVVRALKTLHDQRPLGRVISAIRAVGHRLIHGGEEIREPVVIDVKMKRTIARYSHLAPLHIPPGLEAIAATESAFPDALQAGLFDTAFFAAIPPEAYLYPLPYEWYEQWGIRRFGFHGTSHAYCTIRAGEMLAPEVGAPRLVICHLGQGSSATAVRDGVAVTNTMGFTPLEGFPMGTRSGTVDPGVLLYVQRQHGLTVEQLDDVLHKQSGLLGLSGVSSDFRRVEEAADEGNQRARLALEVYAYRVRSLIGSLAVTLGGVDALVFTGGIGENSVWLRRRVLEGLECLGLHLDDSRNMTCSPDADVATTESPGRVLVIHTREELMIARETRRLASARECP